MSEIKVVNVPEEMKRFLKKEAAERGTTTSKLIIEGLGRAFPKLAKRRTPKEKP